MAEAVSVLAFEVPVVPLLTALAVLLVLLPVPVVDGLVSSHKLAFALAYVIAPLALIVATVWI